MRQLFHDILQESTNRKAIDFGHMDIDDKNVGFVSTGLDQSLEPVGCGIDLESSPEAAVCNRPENAGIVVRNEYP
jgi:hypothetical protein